MNVDQDQLVKLLERLGITKMLINRGYVNPDSKELEFTPKALELIEVIRDEPQKELVNSWIDDYRDIFPKGVVTGGYRVRGDRSACIYRMNKFMQAYPKYDKELILRATREYINRKEQEGFKYIQLAHYFILKDKVSNLASECEALLESDAEQSTFNNKM